MSNYAFLAFTDRGAALAEKLCRALGGSLTAAHGDPEFSLHDWTAANFPRKDALIFVGATGIAVRAVAPFLQSKATDPAVITLDEAGRYVIPLVSGHLGGANALAKEVAALCGGTAVISTATDLHSVFAVDLWAKKQGLLLLQPERIKTVSAKLLAGETVHIGSAWPIAGEPPAGVVIGGEADVLVDVRRRESGALCLVPPVLTLGIGCKKGIGAEQIGAVFSAFLEERGIRPEAIAAAASLDRKAEEPGLLAFCARHGWPVRFFTAEELLTLEGDFSASAFVRETVGVDNVCERSAVASCGGTLVEKKFARDGVTLALAGVEPALDWSV